MAIRITFLLFWGEGTCVWSACFLPQFSPIATHEPALPHHITATNLRVTTFSNMISQPTMIG